MSPIHFSQTPDSCARGAVSITPADSPLTNAVRALYIGSTGDVAVIPINGATPVLFTNVFAGTVLPVSVRQVSATGTTAGNIVGLL